MAGPGQLSLTVAVRCEELGLEGSVAVPLVVVEGAPRLKDPQALPRALEAAANQAPEGHATPKVRALRRQLRLAAERQELQDAFCAKVLQQHRELRAAFEDMRGQVQREELRRLSSQHRRDAVLGRFEVDVECTDTA